MIAPCCCSGTSKWVHRECLDKWRSTSTDAFRACRECKFRYHLEQVPYRGAVSQECAFWLLIARDMAATVISMLLVAAALGGIAYAADTRGGKHGHRALRNALFPSHMSDPAVYCLIGLVLWLAAAGLCFLASLVFCSGDTCTDQPAHNRGRGGCCSQHSGAYDPCMCCYPMPAGGANQCCCFYVGGPGTCNQGPDGCSGGHHNCGNDCGGGGNHGGGEALMLILVVFIVVIAAIGAVAVIWMLVSISASVTRRHMHVLERHMNTKLQRVVDLNGVDFSIFAAETSPRAEESGAVNCQPMCADKTGIAVCSVDLDDNAPTDQEEESPLLSAACSSEF